ncbi:hypothetical protein OZL92_10680 [Bacillus sonorensis]|uniref:Uncharacterized protein n=2 Tax=Bacillus sonorensis TaxID=119858 RepID=M5NYM2_9BACI|nr:MULTISPECIES: hypothetical protein [Bacillus]TWK75638.1 hypothetical protein CHCC20335_0893 [Bacillus paralicheniformis]ASB90548.1 hypothetical protein S101395_04046 [Bacillus sonorensis]EME72951.1 hypothetical protein BSONL12_14474 [Bacillus sonorensis L12]MBG9913968.1 hypothetical protein [Bacillus sonorensis]MCF7616807.1 hypothetical protein [Bacillus sonorensis]
MPPFLIQFMLYFPEDKREYIPSFITLAIFLIITVLVFRLIVKHSRIEAKKAEKLEKTLNQDGHKR